MKKHILLLLFFVAANVFAQQPSKWQATKECNEAKELAKQIAAIKNNGATRSDISQIRSMSNDGQGVLGDLSIVFFDMHNKGSSSDKFATRMYQRCMRSNGY